VARARPKHWIRFIQPGKRPLTITGLEVYRREGGSKASPAKSGGELNSKTNWAFGADLYPEWEKNKSDGEETIQKETKTIQRTYSINEEDCEERISHNPSRSIGTQ